MNKERLIIEVGRMCTPWSGLHMSVGPEWSGEGADTNPVRVLHGGPSSASTLTLPRPKLGSVQYFQQETRR